MPTTLLRSIVRRSLPRLRRYGGRPIFCVPGDHIGDSIFVDGLYEGALLQSAFSTLLGGFARQFAESACLDVGANIGNHSVFFADRFARVVAVEPNPIFCMAFRATMALNGLANVELLECGFGAEAGWLAYQQASAANLGASHFIAAAAAAAPASDHQQLEIRIGDEAVESLGISRLGLIKIDVEGLELAVLEGLKRTLGSQDPVVMFEAHPEVDRAAAEATVEFLRKLGFIHLYSCERPRMSRHASKIKRAVFRLRHGSQPRPVRVEVLDDRQYLMLFASRRPLM
ncbi:MAG TPA: FkbM family methyltransferase [Steroidobacteraceae bacterium]|jgi:FkbM family methyltransferase|nr:FkbM family methyltransferase [Steroidobacteraceae bacterium]